MPHANRLFSLGYVILLAAACRDVAAPGAGPALPDVSSSDGEARYLISYSTYLGGSGDDGGSGIAVDGAGNIYVVGYTFSTNFPTSAGAIQTTRHGQSSDAFVTKLNSASGLVYSTYLGGNDPDPIFGEVATGIAVDAQGDAYVTGYTFSTTFPTTPGALQTSFGGVKDAFVAELNPDGSALLYSTYLGGTGNDGGGGIAVDESGNAYVTGSTNSAAFPTTPGARQTVFGGVNDAFVTALNSTGSGLVYSTYLGGAGNDGGAGIAVDGAANTYITGFTSSTDFPATPGAVQSVFSGVNDVFVTALNSTGSGLVYSTYLGGSGSDVGRAIAVDAAGNAYVAGITASTNFPSTPAVLQTTFAGGTTDAFITALNSGGSALLYSTYLGGTASDQGFGIALDAAGNAYVVGSTGSADFPTTPGAIPGDSIFPPDDAFVTALTGTGSVLVYSMRLGGRGADGGSGIAVDTAGDAYATGFTSNLGGNNFPTTPGAFQPLFGGVHDAFATRITKVALP
jgi:hypothetical protein